MTLRLGQPFYKMTGSGNDFVFFDRRAQDQAAAATDPLASPARVAQLCARGTGVGADGVVFLHASAVADFGILYLNSDGSRAALCGNASLCTTRLAVDLGLADPAALSFQTDAGVIRGRIRDGAPEIDLQPPVELQADVGIARLPGEQRIGYARAGVPHVVVLCADASRVDLASRGKALRWHTGFRDGANANFVSRGADGWRIRTFERGVEGETLACGTGAVATAALLQAWGQVGHSAALRTASGEVLTVESASSSRATASLRGEGRLIFRGELAAG